MSPVSRLKKTWAKVKTAKFDILEVRLTDTGSHCCQQSVGLTVLECESYWVLSY